jgi:hypothetical protein
MNRSNSSRGMSRRRAGLILGSFPVLSQCRTDEIETRASLATSPTSMNRCRSADITLKDHARLVQGRGIKPGSFFRSLVTSPRGLRLPCSATAAAYTAPCQLRQATRLRLAGWARGSRFQRTLRRGAGTAHALSDALRCVAALLLRSQRFLGQELGDLWLGEASFA